jgi:TetR/AcrR family transcriptional regulator
MTAVAAGSRAPVRGRIRQRNEARLLRAAEQVFGEVGYHAATTAAIAERAGLPKSNLHYYFGTKTDLYLRLLENIVAMWWEATDAIRPDEEPAPALDRLVRAKIDLSRRHPRASRIFAAEIVGGARHLLPYLRGPLRAMVDDKSKVIEQWIAAGKMARVEPRHLFFQIWALTQTYADFAEQIAAVLGKRRLSARDYHDAADSVVALVLGGLGLRAPGGVAAPDTAPRAAASISRRTRR